jgi:LPS-assembly lipoprotein
MWWHETGAASRRLVRTGVVLLLAGLCSACFQPMYGEHNATGGPGLRTAMAAVNVAEIAGTPGTPQARLAVELRNELTFALTGGGNALAPTHRLEVTINTGSASIIVDPSTARAEYEIVAVEANYKLVELSSSKTVFTSNASSRTSYNAPGQQQRFAMLRGQRDAQSRATKVVADQIRNRLASYFSAGT